MKNTIDYSVYLVTDRDLMSSKTIEESVLKSIQGGCTVVQLREKNSSSREFFELAKRVHEITKKANIPLIINDRIDVALAINAEGVHIGQSDLPCEIVRKIVGENMIIGVSASNVTDAKNAVNASADYLGVGAMYATGTKTDASVTSLEELRLIRKNIQIPIVVIGGINKNTIPNFKGIGIDGIAIVSAIVSQKDVEKSAKEIKQLFKKHCR
ncbi:MAG: thiamine phosphate synthase [Bacteroidales bacterium]|jgi:thiamine-phosphate pyrophosphorylase|nr:thiamine phosphate synthase [Bacteroidales bacterium]